MGSGLANYNITYINGQLTVNKAALTVTANSAGRPYGATNPVFTATYAGFTNGDTSSVLSGTPSLTTTATSSSPVGNYAITAATGTLTATNYAFNFVNGNLNISAVTLTVTANNTNRVYGATNPVFTVSYVGLTNGDNAGVVSGTPLLTTSAATNSPVANYVITNTPGVLSASNYSDHLQQRPVGGLPRRH